MATRQPAMPTDKCQNVYRYSCALFHIGQFDNGFANRIGRNEIGGKWRETFPFEFPTFNEIGIMNEYTWAVKHCGIECQTVTLDVESKAKWQNTNAT